MPGLPVGGLGAASTGLSGLPGGGGLPANIGGGDTFSSTAMPNFDFNDPSSFISNSTMMLMTQIAGMMTMVMGMLMATLQDIRQAQQNGGGGGMMSALTSAASNGGGPASTGGPSGGGADAPSGSGRPATGAGPAEANFVLPLDRQYIDKPSDSGDFGHRHAPTAGASTYHNGNDFGTGGAEPPIRAVQGGTIRIKPNNGGAGNTVEIDHGNGLVTKYFHLSRFGEFEDGQRIEQGQVLGFVGTTGTSTGNHLHFEVHKDGKAVNPWPYLEAAGA